MNKETGGPAFPSGLIDPSTPEDAVQSLHNGMTMRDYFAAKALHYCLKNCFTKDGAVEESYEIADAMLKAREA
jgi:hypothetical protein